MEEYQKTQVGGKAKKELENSVIRVQITEDGLKAYIRVEGRSKQKPIQKEQIQKALLESQVVYGIDEDAVSKIVKNQITDQDVLVAKGQAPIDGKDGYYEFFFNRFVSTKPIILEDGSVDYSTLGRMEKVKKGQKIAFYNDAIEGVLGRSVKGHQILAKNGKQLHQLLGSGFTVSDDKKTYYSSFDGKIEYSNDKIIITNVLVIESDVDAISGNVDFAGDVLVKGNVMTGSKIRADGNIHVAGYVEASELISSKDIILENGMQGGGRGIIRAGGQVAGKFFEQVDIQADGKVSGNAIMHCKITSKDKVEVSGKRGIVIGGSITALKGVTATIIGSIAEVPTEICVGNDEDVVGKIIRLDVEIKKIIATIKEVDERLKPIVAFLEMKPNAEVQEKKKSLVMTKINLNGKITALLKKRDQYLEIQEHGKNACIIVKKTVYPRVCVRVNGSTLNIKEEFSNVLIKRKGFDVCLFSNED